MLEKCLQHHYFCCSQIPKQESDTQIFQACCCHGEALDLQTDLLLVAAAGDSDQVVVQAKVIRAGGAPWAFEQVPEEHF